MKKAEGRRQRAEGRETSAFCLLLSALILFSCAHVTPPFIDGPQGRLHVDDGGRGSGVPVLFVHGNSGNLTQWRAQLDHERQTRRAVAFDLRGMGMSDVPRNGDYSVSAMADDVDAVVNALKLRHFSSGILPGEVFRGCRVR